MRSLLFVLLAGLALGGTAPARDFAPRVLSPHNADAYSMKTFAQYHVWKDLSTDAKVYAVFRYLAD